MSSASFITAKVVFATIFICFARCEFLNIRLIPDCQSGVFSSICTKAGSVIQSGSANPVIPSGHLEGISGWAFHPVSSDSSNPNQVIDWRIFTSNEDKASTIAHPPSCDSLTFDDVGISDDGVKGNIWIVISFNQQPENNLPLIEISDGKCSYTYGLSNLDKIIDFSEPWYLFTNFDDGAKDDIVSAKNVIKMTLLSKTVFDCALNSIIDLQLHLSSISIKTSITGENIPDFVIENAGITSVEKDCFIDYEFEMLQ